MSQKQKLKKLKTKPRKTTSMLIPVHGTKHLRKQFTDNEDTKTSCVYRANNGQ